MSDHDGHTVDVGTIPVGESVLAWLDRQAERAAEIAWPEGAQRLAEAADAIRSLGQECDQARAALAMWEGST